MQTASATAVCACAQRPRVVLAIGCTCSPCLALHHALCCSCLPPHASCCCNRSALPCPAPQAPSADDGLDEDLGVAVEFEDEDDEDEEDRDEVSITGRRLARCTALCCPHSVCATMYVRMHACMRLRASESRSVAERLSGRAGSACGALCTCQGCTWPSLMSVRT